MNYSRIPTFLILVVVTLGSSTTWGQQQGNRQRQRGQRGGGPSFESLLQRYDSNKDGKLTKEEFRGPAQFFRRLDADQDGVIGKKEFESQMKGSRRRPGMGGTTAGDEKTETSPRLKRYEVFPTQKPIPGDLAPEFELRDIRGEKVSLKELLKTKPVVIETGSYTCPVFRGRHASIAKLHDKYGDKVHLLVLYGKEAHPGSKRFADIKQPTQNEERIKLAQGAAKDLSIQVPVLVDDVNNKVTDAYGGLPNCGYVIGQDGRVFHKLSWIHPRLMTAPIEALIEMGGRGGSNPPAFPVGGNHPSESGQPQKVSRSLADLKNFKDAPGSVSDGSKNKIAWSTDTIDAVQGLARKSNVPVLAEFYFDGCPVCAAMEKGTLTDPQVVAVTRKYLSVKIDLTSEDGEILGDKLGVVGTPAFFLFNAQGKLIASRDGYAETNELIEFLKEGLTRSASSEK